MGGFSPVRSEQHRGCELDAQPAAVPSLAAGQYSLGARWRSADGLQAVAVRVIEGAIREQAGDYHGIFTAHAAPAQFGAEGVAVVGGEYGRRAAARADVPLGQRHRDVAVLVAFAPLDPPEAFVVKPGLAQPEHVGIELSGPGQNGVSSRTSK